MRRKIEKKKTVISISVDPELLETINNIIGNRSKFIQNCIIEEMSKSSKIQTELKNKHIIL